ncbi:MAG: hypothetical protein HWQ38_24250 [Nostoc sp. NMS7]|uniref:hypothetical protein n=1 Tax=Nostoc sp. NMS7 TaxID=2815391 RepID=UPI0025D83852|nr:hypothetical protein [Nostoc sp. NMS7]MBN3949406.1 hypothetical protein [Nostoc sp. NMS7]
MKIPNSWELPKYHFGQRVKQGEITGLEYHPPGTQRAYELGEGWSYTVLVDEYSDYIEIYKERQIEVATQESRKEVQELIDQHLIRIAALTEQLNEGQE